MRPAVEWAGAEFGHGCNEGTVGGIEERLQKLSDPARRPSLRATESGITLSWDKLFIIRTKQPELKQYENMSIVEAGRMMGQHPIDAMLDIAVAGRA